MLTTGRCVLAVLHSNESRRRANHVSISPRRISFAVGTGDSAGSVVAVSLEGVTSPGPPSDAAGISPPAASVAWSAGCSWSTDSSGGAESSCCRAAIRLELTGLMTSPSGSKNESFGCGAMSAG